MENKKKIMIWIIFLIIILIGVLYKLYGLITVNNNSQKLENSTNMQNTLNTDLYNDSNNTLYATERNLDEEDTLAHNEIEGIEHGDGGEYTEDMLDRIEVDIQNPPSELDQYISDLNKFKKEIKRCIYLKGLIDATQATYLKYNIEGDYIYIYYILNDEYSYKLCAKIKIGSEDEIEVEKVYEKSNY